MRLGDEANADSIHELAQHTAATLTAIDSVGVAARLLAMTVSYTKERTAFGKPIAAFQAIKHRCADMLIQLESARVAVWRAAVAVRDGAPDAAEAVSIAKFFATEAASYVAGQALQLHGGIGFTWEHDLHILLKRAKANEVICGTTAWHRERLARALQI
jgi:alkylation response protein AidB-like acyl-CoA dehydrogenase